MKKEYKTMQSNLNILSKLDNEIGLLKQVETQLRFESLEHVQEYISTMLKSRKAEESHIKAEISRVNAIIKEDALTEAGLFESEEEF